MIFVTLGTQDKSFIRLVKAVEKYALHSKEEVVVQAGYTKYDSETMKVIDFLSQDEFEMYMEKADVLVTHAGVGSILTGLQFHKPIVAAARKVEYKEHTNDHQQEILDKFEEDGYVISLNDFEQLAPCIETARKMNVKAYVSNNESFTTKLKTYIDTL